MGLKYTSTESLKHNLLKVWNWRSDGQGRMSRILWREKMSKLKNLIYENLKF